VYYQVHCLLVHRNADNGCDRLERGSNEAEENEKSNKHYSPYLWGSDTRTPTIEVNTPGSTVEHWNTC
jgi:hypothetical protein